MTIHAHADIVLTAENTLALYRKYVYNRGMNSIYIYGIENDGAIYYIGRTKDLKQRMRQHRYLGRKGTMVLLATVDTEDAIAVERYYIAKYRAQLTNKKERYYTGVSVKDIQDKR